MFIKHKNSIKNRILLKINSIKNKNGYLGTVALHNEPLSP